MKRVALVLAVLAGLLVIGDRVAVTVAQRAVAAQLQLSQALPSVPDVTIGGFPFLTQALSGRYDRITVVAHDLPARPGSKVAVHQLTVLLTGCQVPLGDVIASRVRQVPVAGLRATAVLAYPDLEAASGSRALRLTPVGGRLRVSGVVTVLGLPVPASVVADVSLRGDVVRLTGSDVTVSGRSVPALVLRALRGALDYSVAVGRLPFGLHLTGVAVTPAGIAVSAQAAATVLAPS